MIKLEHLKDQYKIAKPFPHVVIDNAFDVGDMYSLFQKFPTPDESWWKYDNVLEKKLAKNDLTDVHKDLKHFIYDLQANAFVSQLEKLTGIDGLIVDHTLNGGGFHQITRGGKLDIHADYNYHPITKLDRRVNVLFYLNPIWDPAWKGYLELWDKGMNECVKSIAPILNRMVIFSTTDDANHGHPDPLECPAQMTRKSIALYYYTNGRPKEEKSKPHSTVFKRRPNDPLEWGELRRQRAIRRIDANPL